MFKEDLGMVAFGLVTLSNLSRILFKTVFVGRVELFELTTCFVFARRKASASVKGFWRRTNSLISAGRPFINTTIRWWSVTSSRLDCFITFS